MDKTIVALYDDVSHARDAVQELVDNGIPRDNISLVARNPEDRTGTVQTDVTMGETSATAEGAGVGAGIGAALGGVGGILVGLGALAIPGIGPVLAAGPLAAALGGIAGAGAGAIAGGAAGGLIGGLTDMGVAEEQAGYYAEGVRRGGTLLTVHADENMTSRAVDIMDRHAPVDIKDRSHNWRSEGWTGFDPNRPLSGQDFDRTRDRDMYDTDVTTGRTDIGTTDIRQDVHGDFTRDVTDVGLDYDRDVTDVDMDRDTSMGMTDTGYTAPGTGYSGIRTFDMYEEDFRQDFNTNFGSRGFTYDQYRPAYRYGYDLAGDDRYRGRNWNEIEPEIRRDWERRHPESAWEEFKDTVRRSWEKVKSSFD